MMRPPGHYIARPSLRPATMLLWILAGVSTMLLVYEGSTLLGSVLGPLRENPHALQTDFHYYYDAAIRFRQDPQRLYLASDDVIAGFTYPPPAIVPFAMLSNLSLGSALVWLTTASYAALLVSAWLWRVFLSRQGVRASGVEWIVVALVILACGPTYMNAIFGQVNAFVLLSCVVFMTLARSSPAGAGTLLALGAWLKIYPGLLTAGAAWDRRLSRATLHAIVATAAIVVVLLPIVPLSAYQTFFADVIPSRFDKTAIHITNQSLTAFLERFRYPSGQFLNWTGEQAVTVAAAVRWANWSGALIALAWFGLRYRRGDQVASTASLIALVAVIAPLGWGHTYMLVVPLLMLHVAAMRDAATARATFVFLCVTALMIPAGRRLPIDSWPDWLENVVYSRYLLATLALMGLTHFSDRRN